MTATLIETDTESGIGLVLVVHGLNNKPEVMDSLIGVLVDSGFHCMRVSLYEDAPDGRADPSEITRAWRAILANAYATAQDRYPDLPRFALSYSLGALTTISFLDTETAPTFDRMVLLAPPVALTRSASLVRALTPLGRFNIALPSAAPKAIRARRGTPLSEYAAMLELVDKVDTLRHPEKLGQIPTAIYLDPDDELVGYAGVLDWIHRNGLEKWSPRGFKGRDPEGRTYSHLMVLEKSLGSVAWTELTQYIVAHFKEGG
ncbi:MAG: lysophospholipase [Actinomycetia bacterium]|nr:lysophospholipase [Actinomycetes bacterium]